jgi:hypothetical protein
MNPAMPPITSPVMKIVFAAFWNTTRLYCERRTPGRV